MLLCLLLLLINQCPNTINMMQQMCGEVFLLMKAIRFVVEEIQERDEIFQDKLNMRPRITRLFRAYKI